MSISHELLMFWIKLYKLIFLFTIFFSFPAHSIAEEHDIERYVNVSIIPERTNLLPGDTIYLAIEEDIYPNWHTYWKNPGDSGEPTSIEWDLPDGFEVGPLRFPVPEVFPIGPLINYGFKDKITLLQELYVPDEIPDGPIKLTANVHLLVCEEICIPESSSHEIVFNNDITTSNAEYIDKAYMKLPTVIDWDSIYKEENDALILTIESKFPASLKTINLEEARFIPEEWGLVDYTANLDASINPPFLTLSKKRGERPLNEITALKGVLTYLDPYNELTALEFTAYPDPEALIENSEENKNEASLGSNLSPNNLSTTNLATALFFAVLGGLILNLMPCVFPILSMKALSLCALREKELKAAKLHGLAYTFGIVFTFLIIAILLISIKSAGEAAGWGFQLQNPMMVLSLAWLFYLIGLNLIDFFSLNIVLGVKGSQTLKNHGYINSFLTGVLATIVATPCTAPFMGVAMGFAITQPTLISLTVFIALGFGLALPYLLLSFFPFLQKILPKPGAWMDKFKKILSIPMFVSALWLVWVLNQQIESYAIFAALAGMALLTLAIWLIKSSQNQKNGNTFATIVAILVCAIVFKAGNEFTKKFAFHVESTAVQNVFSLDSLNKHLNKNDNAVFVNMTAAWCITCKLNEKLVLDLESTKSFFEENNVHYILGDWTNKNPEITHYLEKFDRTGVPLYIYYGAKINGQRPEPIILPQILTPNLLQKTIIGEN
jgi:thiol:disulfide interchange protein DsbD